MSSPWETQAPFEPMFDSSISLSGTRETGSFCLSSLQACVFPIENVEPLVGIDLDSGLQKINCVIHCDSLSAVKPQIGDSIMLADSTQYKITHISKSYNDFNIEARGVE